MYKSKPSRRSDTLVREARPYLWTITDSFPPNLPTKITGSHTFLPLHHWACKVQVGQLNRVNPRRPSDRTHPSDRNMAGTDLRSPWPAFVLSYRWIACCVRCCVFGRGPRRSSLVGIPTGLYNEAQVIPERVRPVSSYLPMKFEYKSDGHKNRSMLAR